MMLMNPATVPVLNATIQRIELLSLDQAKRFFEQILLDPKVGFWCANEQWTPQKARAYGADKYWDGGGSDRVWISFIDGEPVGYAAIEGMSLDSIGWVHGVSIGVLGAYQGRGLGVALLSKLARVADCHRMHLHLITLPHNAAMRATASKVGFQDQNTLVNYSNMEWAWYKYCYKQSN